MCERPSVTEHLLLLELTLDCAMCPTAKVLFRPGNWITRDSRDCTRLRAPPHFWAATKVWWGQHMISQNGSQNAGPFGVPVGAN
eukprot:gene10912-biopygen19841